MAELVDAPDSKSGSERSVGSSPTTRTMISFRIVTKEIPNIFGSKILTDKEKENLLKFFLNDEAKESIRLESGYANADDKFYFIISSLERTADFLSLLYLQGRSAALIKIPMDSRKAEVLAKLTAAGNDSFLVIKLHDTNSKPYAEGTYVCVVREHALKLKLQWS